MLGALAHLCASAMIVVMGQSLAAGGAAAPVLTTVVDECGSLTTYNLDFGSGFVVSPHASAFPFSGAVEFNSRESPRAGIAGMYCQRTGSRAFMAVGAAGGAVYTSIKKGTTQPWLHMSAMVEAASARLREKCVASVLIHGESDHGAGTTRATYKANIFELQTDLATKCRDVGSIVYDTPMYVDQFSSWTSSFFAGTNTTSVIPLAVYDAARERPGRVIMVQPHYWAAHGADVHFTNAGSRSVGAKIGQVIAHGPTWQPLWPRLSSPVERTTNVITVHLHTPFPPLVVDTTNVTGVSETTRGFEYTDDSGPPSITAVDCSAACSGNTCSCQITLSGTPTGANKKLRYAYTGVDNAAGGPTSGPRGNIRDSDTATWQGANLYNWLVHFEENVP